MTDKTDWYDRLFPKRQSANGYRTPHNNPLRCHLTVAPTRGKIFSERVHESQCLRHAFVQRCLSVASR